MDDITIRRAATGADYRACQEAQRRAWGLTEHGDVVPVATLVGAQLHGGLVLGAFRPDGAAVGLSFAFLGRVEGRLCLYSQLTGVVPGFQGRGVGRRLKHAQREWARSEGLERLAWAFDPLQEGNAHFNLETLGASAGRYIEDMYGPRADALNQQSPTDRLIAEWETAPRPRQPVSAAEVRALPRVLAATARADGRLDIDSVATGPEGQRILLEIPAAILRLRQEDPPLAERWQRAVRQGFLAAFAAGYRAVGFFRDEAPGSRRSFYLLHRSGEGDRPSNCLG